MSDEKNKQHVNYFFALSSYILSHGEWHGKKNRAAPCPAMQDSPPAAGRGALFLLYRKCDAISYKA